MRSTEADFLRPSPVGFLKVPHFLSPTPSPAPPNLPQMRGLSPPTEVPTQVFAQLVTDSALAAALYSQSALGKEKPGKKSSSLHRLPVLRILRKAVRIHKTPLILMSNFHFETRL